MARQRRDAQETVSDAFRFWKERLARRSPGIEDNPSEQRLVRQLDQLQAQGKESFGYLSQYGADLRYVLQILIDHCDEDRIAWAHIRAHKSGRSFASVIPDFHNIDNENQSAFSARRVTGSELAILEDLVPCLTLYEVYAVDDPLPSEPDGNFRTYTEGDLDTLRNLSAKTGIRLDEQEMQLARRLFDDATPCPTCAQPLWGETSEESDAEKSDRCVMVYPVEPKLPSPKRAVFKNMWFNVAMALLGRHIYQATHKRRSGYTTIAGLLNAFCLNRRRSFTRDDIRKAIKRTHAKLTVYCERYEARYREPELSLLVRVGDDWIGIKSKTASVSPESRYLR